MKRTAPEAIDAAPPAVGHDMRLNAVQQGMINSIGRQGWLPPALQSNIEQWSSMNLATTSIPASTAKGLANPRISEVMSIAIEAKTIFRAENGDVATILGPNGVSPLSQTTSSAFVAQRIIVNSHLPSAVPVRGRVRMGTIQKTQYTGKLSSFGIGLEMTVRAFNDVDGPMLLRLAVEQNANGSVDFMLLMVYNMLQHSFDFGLQQFVHDMNQRQQRIQLRFVDWLEREKLFVGIMQREEHPIETLMGYVRRQMQLMNRTPDILIVNDRIGNFMHHVRAYTEFFRAGAAGPSNVVVDGTAALQARMGIAVHVVRTSSIDDNGQYDFMTNQFRYGEFVPMLNLYTPTQANPYRTQWRDVWLLDARTDSWRRVSLRDALWHSGRWDPQTGELLSINKFNDIDGAPASSDPFHIQNQRGQLEPIKFFGQMPLLTPKALHSYASMETSSLEPEQIIALNKAFSVLRTYAELSRQQRFTADAEKLLASLAESGDLSETGRFTLPENSGDLKFPNLPPFFGTAAGLRAISTGGEAFGVKTEIVSAITSAFATVDQLAEKVKADDSAADAIINIAIGARYPAIRLNIARAREGRSELSSDGSNVIYREDLPAAAMSARSRIPEIVIEPVDSQIGRIGTALGISAAARSGVETKLTGAWKTVNGELVAAGDNSLAPLVRLELLRTVGSRIDTGASDPNALAAVSLVNNYGYTNAANPAGVHHTEHLRGLMLAGLQHVATAGDRNAVSERIGSYLGWLASRGYTPARVSAPLTAPATDTQVRAFGEDLRTFVTSDAGKAIFADTRSLNTAVRAVGTAAGALAVETIAARIGAPQRVSAPQRVGLPYAGKPEEATTMPLQYTSAQLAGYRASVMDPEKPTIVLFESPTRPGETIGAEELAQINGNTSLGDDARTLRGVGDEPALVTKMREIARTMTNPVSLAFAVKFLLRSTSWQSIEEMLYNNIPIPITPFLLRWRAILSSSGMIATKRGAQVTKYAFPISSLTNDDTHQVMRAQTKFEAGVFQVDPMATYLMRHLLITGCSQSGFNVDFATREEFALEQETGAPAGSIISILEPAMDESDVPEIISAHGSWEKANVDVISISDATALHHHNSDWLRKYWGLRKPNKRAADHGGVTGLSEINSMWRGAYRPHDPITTRLGEVQRGTGFFAHHNFYGPGLITAWRNAAPYPKQGVLVT